MRRLMCVCVCVRQGLEGSASYAMSGWVQEARRQVNQPQERERERERRHAGKSTSLNN